MGQYRMFREKMDEIEIDTRRIAVIRRSTYVTR